MSNANPPEFRRCPLSNHGVLLAPERAARPLGLSHSKPTLRANAERDRCPFCVGMEHETPNSVYSQVDPIGSEWQLRVFPNKFPAVRESTGIHEVVVECRRHESDPVRLSTQELANLFIAYRERVLVLRDAEGIEHVQVFKNVGAEAGASLAHLHSQIVATRVIPDIMHTEHENANKYYHKHNRDLFEDMIRNDSLYITGTESFALVCPYAPRFPYETWLLPRSPQPEFQRITNPEAQELARLLGRYLLALDEVLGQPAYNWYLHSSPKSFQKPEHYRWHLEILPRTSRSAGFEWSTGWYINAVPPERAAVALRERMPS